MTFCPSVNLPSLGLRITYVPSFSLKVDFEPLKVKSNQSLAPHMYPTIVINKPRYPKHIPIS